MRKVRRKVECAKSSRHSPPSASSPSSHSNGASLLSSLPNGRSTSPTRSKTAVSYGLVFGSLLLVLLCIFFAASQLGSLHENGNPFVSSTSAASVALFEEDDPDPFNVRGNDGAPRGERADTPLKKPLGGVADQDTRGVDGRGGIGDHLRGGVGGDHLPNAKPNRNRFDDLPNPNPFGNPFLGGRGVGDHFPGSGGPNKGILGGAGMMLGGERVGRRVEKGKRVWGRGWDPEQVIKASIERDKNNAKKNSHEKQGEKGNLNGNMGFKEDGPQDHGAHGGRGRGQHPLERYDPGRPIVHKADGEFDPAWTVNEYFDRVLVLNLDSEIEKWYRTSARLHKYGIQAERIAARDPNEPKHHSGYENWLNRPVTELEEERGERFYSSPEEWALQFAIADALELAKQRGYQRFLLLSDDILLHKDFLAEFDREVRNISPNWKLLFLGVEQKNWIQPDYLFFGTTYEDFYHPLRVDGAVAIGFEESVYDKLIDGIFKLQGSFAQFPLYSTIREDPTACFVFYPNLIISDLESSHPELTTELDRKEYAFQLRWNRASYDTAPIPQEMLEPPKVSVICTFKNAAKTIEMALRSVLYQTYTNLELIVVDDESDDNSAEIVQKLAAADPRVILIQNQENIGTYMSRNVALEASTGQIITFQDADDISLPFRIEKQMQRIRNGEVLMSVGLVIRSHVPAPEFEKCFGEGFIDFLTMDEKVERGRVHFRDNAHMVYQYCCQHILGLMTTMYARRVFDEIGDFDGGTRFGGDAEFVERLLAHYAGFLLPASETAHSFLWRRPSTPPLFHRLDEVVLWSIGQNSSLSKRIPIGGDERARYRESYVRKLRDRINRRIG